MGQLIDFSGKKERHKIIEEPYKRDIVSYLPILKKLKGEIILFHITNEVLYDEKIMSNFIRDIVILKCLGVVVVLVPDNDAEIEKYYNETYSEKLFFDNFCSNTNGISDVIEVIMKHNGGKKIVNQLKDYKVLPLCISGKELGIVFPDNVVSNGDNIYYSFQQREQNGDKSSKFTIDILNEIIGTDILPIILPSCKDKQDNEYIMSSGYFAMYLSKYLNAIRFITVYKDNNQIPQNCIYGVERFVKIIKTNSFNERTIKTINPAIEAIKNGVQVANLIDISSFSIIEELCAKVSHSLVLYDDVLQEI